MTPLTLWAHEANPVILETVVRTDTSLTHTHPAAGEAAAVLAITLQALLQGALPATAVEKAHAFARRSGFSREVIETVVEAREPSSSAAGAAESMTGLTVLREALFQVVHVRSFEEALEGVLKRSPASDALGAIVGSLAGARFGREGVPRRLRYLVLACRPLEGAGALTRPSTYWATDAMVMAEALLTARES